MKLKCFHKIISLMLFLTFFSACATAPKDLLKRPPDSIYQSVKSADILSSCIIQKWEDKMADEALAWNPSQIRIENGIEIKSLVPALRGTTLMTRILEEKGGRTIKSWVGLPLRRERIMEFYKKIEECI